METIEKMHMMDKMLRELLDITNSQTSLLKKIAQLEADNINLGNSLLDKKLPDIHEKVDQALTEVSAVNSEFTQLRNKFVDDNKLNEVLLAMEIAESKIEGSIRISLGAHTTENDILSFMNAFESVYKEIKELLK